MPRSLAATLGLTLLMSSNTLAQGLKVEHERYRLDNGLTVILHEDHSSPVATINLWYGVGSKDEVVGRSGFAHLFEHLMFMGTERVPDGNFDTIMENGGGWNNATTSADRTNYFSFGPANLLETLLWLDADRLDDLGRMMTQEKLDKQRDVVRNERRQSYENRPYGQASLRLQELMYPPGHPYHLPVIGSHADLEAATVEDVVDFFSTYYVPNNASLVVAGDFDPAVIKPIIERLFGTLPRGSEPVRRPQTAADAVRLKGVIRNTVSDDVQVAKTMVAYHSPAVYADGDAEMDLIGAVLSDGISSRLYRRLVYDHQLASDVRAYQRSMLLGSLFVIEATQKPGVCLDAIEAAIDEVLEDLKVNPPEATELERQKAAIEFTTVDRLQSLQARADALNRYNFHFDEPDSFELDLDRYRAPTPADLSAWARRVFNADERLILRVLPELAEPEVDPRDQRPEVAAIAPFVPQQPETFELSTGVVVHHFHRPGLPLVEVRALLDGGAVHDPAAQAGLASLAIEMLDEGAGDRDAMQFETAAHLLGATIDFAAGRLGAEGRMAVLKKNFDPAAGLLADAIVRPRLDSAEWDRVKALRTDALARRKDDPGQTCRLIAARAYYGADHAYGRSVQGTESTLSAIGLDDIGEFIADRLKPQSTTLLVAGDLSADEAKKTLEAAFAGWKRGADEPTRLEISAPPTSGLRVVIVDRPDAVQTVVRFVMPAPDVSDPSRVPLQLLGTILGGSFTSRLNQNLREENGYTYGAGCGFAQDPHLGTFVAQSSVRADVTGAAVAEFLAEFAAIRGGDISADEVGKARANLRSDVVASQQDLSAVLDSAAQLIRASRPFSSLAADLEASETITREQLNGLAKSAIPLEDAVLVLVGDRTSITEQLKGLDLPEPISMTLEEADPASD